MVGEAAREIALGTLEVAEAGEARRTILFKRAALVLRVKDSLAGTALWGGVVVAVVVLVRQVLMVVGTRRGVVVTVKCHR